jgi:hypothetical protein
MGTSQTWARDSQSSRPIGSSSTSSFTRSAWVQAKRTASMPPVEWPTTSTSRTLRLSRSRAVFATRPSHRLHVDHHFRHHGDVLGEIRCRCGGTSDRGSPSSRPAIRNSLRRAGGGPSILLSRAALSADLVELRLLFVAERGVKVVEHGTDVLDRSKHRAEPPGDRAEVDRRACW